MDVALDGICVQERISGDRPVCTLVGRLKGSESREKVKNNSSAKIDIRMTILSCHVPERLLVVIRALLSTRARQFSSATFGARNKRWRDYDNRAVFVYATF